MTMGDGVGVMVIFSGLVVVSQPRTRSALLRDLAEHLIGLDPNRRQQFEAVDAMLETSRTTAESSREIETAIGRTIEEINQIVSQAGTELTLVEWPEGRGYWSYVRRTDSTRSL